MKPFRVAVAAVATLVISACAKTDKAATDSTTPTPPPPPPTISLADVAGKWQMTSTPMSGKDTTSTKYVMTATADTTGWMMTYPSGLKVPLHVTVSGDSVLLKSGVYASQRRKGVKVSVEGSAHMVGGKWVGMTTAHYQGTKDSVLTLRTAGTKMP